MDSNTHSNQPLTGQPADQAAGRPASPPDARPDRLGSVVAARQELATQDLDGLSEVALAEDTERLQRLLDGLAGEWLRRLAAVDARGAAGADLDQPALSTPSWLRNRLHMGVGAAHSAVRTARALFSGSLPETAAALVAGDISPAHARVVADGTQELPDHVKLDADPVVAELAGRLDPPQLRRAVDHLCRVVDPDGADRQAERHHERRGLWLAPTWEGMVALKGLLEPEDGAMLQAALEPIARPADANDPRKGSQRNADALAELARRALEGGGLPKAGGVRPQLLVTVDLDSLRGHPGALGGETGWAGALAPETCRRLACDGAVTRVVVSRQPAGPGGGNVDHDPGADLDADPPAGLQAQLRAAMAGLPAVLGGAPCRPLDVGRSTRIVQPAQRAALAVRDGGCVFPGCDRPLAWCDAHHLVFWLDGGPTDLANLALLCRAHHRAVHEGGWHLARGPDGRFTATPPQRRRRPAA